MRNMMDLITREFGIQPTRSPEQLVAYNRLAAALHYGQTVLDLMPD
jgi:hypothetical protein